MNFATLLGGLTVQLYWVGCILQWSFIHNTKVTIAEDNLIKDDKNSKKMVYHTGYANLRETAWRLDNPLSWCMISSFCHKCNLVSWCFSCILRKVPSVLLHCKQTRYVWAMTEAVCVLIPSHGSPAAIEISTAGNGRSLQGEQRFIKKKQSADPRSGQPSSRSVTQDLFD